MGDFHHFLCNLLRLPLFLNAQLDTSSLLYYRVAIYLFSVIFFVVGFHRFKFHSEMTVWSTADISQMATFVLSQHVVFMFVEVQWNAQGVSMGEKNIFVHFSHSLKTRKLSSLVKQFPCPQIMIYIGDLHAY